MTFVKAAMGVLNFSPEEQNQIWRVVAFVLHLGSFISRFLFLLLLTYNAGNVAFTPDPRSQGQVRAMIQNKDGRVTIPWD